MNKVLLAALCLLCCRFAIATDLASKHPTLNPSTMPAMTQCLACHGSYVAIAEKTKNLTPNPHRSHMADVQCDACHQWKGKGKLMCNECHQFPALEKALQ